MTFKSSSWYLQERNLYPWMHFTELFSKEQCEEITRLGKNLALTEGVVGTGDQDFGTNYSLRSARVGWFDSADDSANWIYRHLTEAVNRANSDFWKFNVEYLEGLQFTAYNKPGDHQDTHMDTGWIGEHYRKLTVIIQLTDPETYEGADLELQLAHDYTPMTRAQGSMIVFPSFILHRVKPLISGERHSLVSWVCGTPFK